MTRDPQDTPTDAVASASNPDQPKASKRARPNRSASRLGAVQALYQMDMAATDLNAVIEEFSLHRFPAANADDGLAGGDVTFFAELLRGVVRRQRQIDPAVDTQLASGWRLQRVDSILRAILRAGAFELLERPDVPARVVITEYINVAHAFFAGDEPRVVNGVMDRLARSMRAAEFAPGHSQSYSTPQTSAEAPETTSNEGEGAPRDTPEAAPDGSNG